MFSRFMFFFSAIGAGGFDLLVFLCNWWPKWIRNYNGYWFRGSVSLRELVCFLLVPLKPFIITVKDWLFQPWWTILCQKIYFLVVVCLVHHLKLCMCFNAIWLSFHPSPWSGVLVFVRKVASKIWWCKNYFMKILFSGNKTELFQVIWLGPYWSLSHFYRRYWL